MKTFEFARSANFAHAPSETEHWDHALTLSTEVMQYQARTMSTAGLKRNIGHG